MALSRPQKIALAAFVLGSSLLGLSIYKGGRSGVCRLVPYNPPIASDPIPPQLPDWTLKDVDGVEHRVPELAGNLTILAFWATWCPNCHRQLETLSELYRSHGAEGLSVIGISLDGAKREDQVARYVEEKMLPFPVLIADATRFPGISAISAVPTLLLYDPQGEMVARFIGAIGGEDLLTIAAPYLAIDSIAAATSR